MAMFVQLSYLAPIRPKPCMSQTVLNIFKLGPNVEMGNITNSIPLLFPRGFCISQTNIKTMSKTHLYQAYVRKLHPDPGKPP